MSIITLPKGISLYYEMSGKGKAVLLLHGNGEDHQIFHRLIKRLEKNFCVYAIDSRDHGQSSRVSQLDYQDMVIDIAEFIQILKIDQPLVIGFSDGGIVGLMLASQFPSYISKLVVCGANTRPSGLKAECLRQMKAEYAYHHDQKIGMMLKQKAMTKDELRKIEIPVCVMAGSEDLIRESHTREIAQLVKHSELHILDGEDHGSYVVNGDKLFDVIQNFIHKKRFL